MYVDSFKAKNTALPWRELLDSDCSEKITAMDSWRFAETELVTKIF